MTTTTITCKTRAAALISARVFKHNAKFTRKEFTKLAKQINPNLFALRNNDANKMRSNLELVKTQALINTLLADQGFYLKSADYHQLFYVIGDKRIKKEVRRYDKAIGNNIRRYAKLDKGIKVKEDKRKSSSKNPPVAPVVPATRQFYSEM